MNEVNIKICPCCEISLEKQNLNGMSMPWKDFPEVLVMKDIFIWSCPSCGEHIIKSNDMSMLDDILENVIKDETYQILHELKEKTGLNQKKLAIQIGVSEVYFSKLIGKKTIPSFEKFSYLRLLLQNPDYLFEKIIVGAKLKQNQNNVDNVIELEKFKHLKENDKKKYVREKKFKGMLDNKSGVVN